MKRLPWILALACLACLVYAAPAGAYGIVFNGSFETGDLFQWQIFNQGASGGTGSWYAKSSGNGVYSGLPTAPPAAGSWQAVADNNGRVAAILYQDINIPLTTKATLSFVLWYGTPAAYVNGSSLSPSLTNQRVRVDIITTSANLLLTSGALQLIHASAPGSPSTFTPTTITADVTALAGQTVRLRFALVGTQGAIIAGVDNVQLEVTPFAPKALPVALDGGAAHFGDFDGDGKYEVAQMGSDGNNGIWNVSHWDFGTQQWVQVQNLLGMRDGDMALADIDRDGDLDMGGVGTTMSRIHDLVFNRNDGGFSFTTIQAPLMGGTEDPGTRFGSIDWGDQDTDGDLDAVVTGYVFSTNEAATWLERNDGSGDLTAYLLDGVPAVTQGAAVWCDLNGDDHLDVAVCGAEISQSYIWQSTGYAAMFGSLPAVTEGALALGDLDYDGDEDLVLTGMNGSTPITKIYRHDYLFVTPIWTEISTSIPGVYQSSVSLADFDGDGLIDIAICGNTGSGLITRLYHNNSNMTFSDMNANLPGVKLGTVEIGDFNFDGKPDLLLQGNDGTNRIARTYIDTENFTNNPPYVPAVTTESLSGSTLSLSIPYYANDDHIFGYNLTNNVRAGSSSGAGDIIPPMSTWLGRRMIPRRGTTRQLRTIPLTAIGHGSLYWSAQTIDASLIGGDWSSERVFTPGPAITLIQDVPADQGGHVRLTLNKSMLDDESVYPYPAAGYNVWRLVPPGSMAQAIAREGRAVEPATATRLLKGGDGRAEASSSSPSDRAAATDLRLTEWNGRLFTRSAGVTIASPFPAGTWEIVGSFYATQEPSYLIASSTLADSGSSGLNNQTFIVSVHTTTPSVWFASLPVSGHSVDNIAPAAPTGLSAAHHTGSGNQLAWQPAPETDFEAFHVYRGTTAGFVPGPSNLVASVPNPAWTDPSYDSPVVYYRVSTLDHAGNESPAVAPGSTTAVGGGQDAPLEFALQPASPNPFGGMARIGFALPRASDVRLDVFDAGGRLVRTLLDGALPAGKHEAMWTGADQSGHRVDAGVYFYRLRAGTFMASRRVAFVP